MREVFKINILGSEMCLGYLMKQLFRLKKSSFVIIVAVNLLFFVSACTIPHSSVYVDNNVCAASIVNNYISVVQEDFPKIFKGKEFALMQAKKVWSSNILKKKEFETMTITFKGNEYSYMLQNDDGICSLKLYDKKTQTYHLRNMVTFIKGWKLPLCKCGGSRVDVTL